MSANALFYVAFFFLLFTQCLQVNDFGSVCGMCDVRALPFQQFLFYCWKLSNYCSVVSSITYWLVHFSLSFSDFVFFFCRCVVVSFVFHSLRSNRIKLTIALLFMICGPHQFIFCSIIDRFGDFIFVSLFLFSIRAPRTLFNCDRLGFFSSFVWKTINVNYQFTASNWDLFFFVYVFEI